jgi:arylsulfatase A-like enzyme
MTATPARRPPNIILINCDDLGYGDVGCYGSNRNDTPHLDRLAAEGTRFTNFYMAAPVCSPSRAAMLTGCYSQRVGLAEGCEILVLRPGEPMGLSPEELTAAEMLRRGGYATKLIGKWHLGDQREFLPCRHGFEEYFGIPYSNDMGIDSRRPGPPLPLLTGEEVVETEPDQRLLTHRMTAEGVDFIRRNASRPFFLYFAHYWPHTPLRPHPDFAARARNGKFGAVVEAIDWSTGVLMGALEELGLAEDTLILFTSDNGSTGRNGASNLPLRGRKGTTYEGGMRLPLIARWPGGVPAGGVRDEIVSSMDLMPTFASLCGGEMPTDRVIDGRDFSGLLCGEKGATGPREEMFYYFRYELQAVRRGRWKLHTARGELYDLQDDPTEQINLHAARPEIVRELADLADAARDDLGDSAVDKAPGRDCRKPGWVDNPRTLTECRSEDPRVQAEYD